MCDYCSWIEQILRPSRTETLPMVCTNVIIDEKKTVAVKFDPTILVHGTADSISSKEEIMEILETIEEAAIEAYRELNKGAETVDSIELAIRYLESEESFSNIQESTNESGEKKISVIKDAAIMDSDSNVGSVGAVTHVDHPITLAKKVLRNTDHVLIVENGIRNLDVESSDLCQSDNSNGHKIRGDSLRSNGTKNSKKKIKNVCYLGKDFVKKVYNGLRIWGAVARDRKGRLACGNSTCDYRYERIARSSMSAGSTVLGCGIFADAKSCCSISGTDTNIYLYAPARKIVARLKREILNKSDDRVVPIEDVLAEELKKFMESTGESSIAAAALSVEGDAKVAFESKYFPWACCARGKVTSGFIKDEITMKDIEDLDMPLDCECH